MSETKTQRRLAARRRRRRLGVLLAAVVLAMAFAAGAVKLHYAPASARRRLLAALGEVWDGPARLGDVGVGLTGTVHLRGVELSDRQGRPRVRIASARIECDSLLAGRLVARRIRLDGVDCQLHLAAGSPLLPVSRPGEGARKMLDLDQLVADPIALRLLPDPPEAHRPTYGRVALRLEREADGYRLQLTAPPGAVSVRAVPAWGPADEKVHLALSHGRVTLTPQTAPDPAWKSLLAGAAGEGSVAFEGSIQYDPTRNDLEIGQLRLASPKDLRIDIPQTKTVLKDVRWARFDLTQHRVDLADFSAEGWGGHITAGLTVDGWRAPAERRFHLSVNASKTLLAEMISALDAPPAERLAGKVNLALALHGGRIGWEGLSGQGHIHIQEGDFASVPLVDMMLHQLRLGHDRDARSALQGVFTISGSVLNIRHAAVASPSAGIECTGGTVDLATGEVDVTVVGGDFLSMDALSALLLGDLRSKLLARRVRGQWRRLKPEDFAPLPAASIADSSISLLFALARGQGRFGAGLIRGFEQLFQAIQPRP